MADIPEVIKTLTDAEKENSICYVAPSKSITKQLTNVSFLSNDEDEEFGIELNLEEVPYVISPGATPKNNVISTGATPKKVMGESQNFNFSSPSKQVVELAVCESTNLPEKTSIISPNNDKKEKCENQNLITTMPAKNEDEDIAENEANLTEQEPIVSPKKAANVNKSFDFPSPPKAENEPMIADEPAAMKETGAVDQPAFVEEQISEAVDVLADESVVADKENNNAEKVTFEADLPEKIAEGHPENEPAIIAETLDVSISPAGEAVNGHIMVDEQIVPEKKVVDYDTNPSALYKAMQVKNWKVVMDRIDEYPDDVSTWIRRKEKDGSTRWCLLPIHAALIFKAPVHVVAKLLSIYPESGLCNDDQGMCPLHLAFRHGSNDAVLYEILSSCPDAIDAKDDKGRTPLALHSTYVARANAQETPSANGDHVQKMRASAFEKYVTVASDRARKSVKSKLEAHYLNKLKAIHDDHTSQLENLRKLASDEFTASRERIKELEKKKKSIESLLNEKKKEVEDLLKGNETKTLSIAKLENLLSEISTAKEKESTELSNKISNLEAEIQDLRQNHEQEVIVFKEKAVLSEENSAVLISKLTAAEEEIKQMKKSNSELQTKSLELAAAVEDRVTANERLSKKYEMICESEKVLTTKLFETESSLTSTSKALKESEALLAKMNYTIRDLRVDISNKANNVRTLSEEVEKLVLEVEEKKQKSEELEEINRDLVNSSEELKMKYHIQCCENQDLASQVSELTAELQQTSEKLNLSEGACMDKEKLIDKCEALLKEKVDEVIALKAALDEKSFDYNQMKSGLEEKLEKTSRDLGCQAILASDCELKLHDLQQSYNTLQHDFEEKCKLAEELGAELDEIRTQSIEELELKEAELNRLMKSLSDYHEKFQEIARTTESIVGELNSKSDQEVELRHQLEQSKQEFEEMIALKDNEFCNMKEKYEALEIESNELKNQVELLEEDQLNSKELILNLSENLTMCNNEITYLEAGLKDKTEEMEMAAALGKEKEKLLENTIVELEIESLRSLQKTQGLELEIESLEKMVKEVKGEGEAKQLQMKQQLEDADMNLASVKNEFVQVLNSSKMEIEQLKSKLAEKTTEISRHREKNQLLDEVTLQMRKRVMDLEQEKAKVDSEIKEKIASDRAEIERMEKQLAELEICKSKEVEEVKIKAANAQAQMDREMKHLRTVNEKKSEMNATLQRQLREMSSHMQQLTENLLRLSAQHEKFVEVASSHGISLESLKE